MDAIRKQLDVLMGANRNGDVTEVNRKYYDRDVCRLFLVGLCPHELFQLTGDMTQMRKETGYEEAKAKGLDNYDRDLEDVIDRLIVECDRKITRALKRLEDENAKAAFAISVSEVTQTPAVLELSKQIKEKLKEVDQYVKILLYDFVVGVLVWVAKKLFSCTALPQGQVRGSPESEIQLIRRSPIDFEYNGRSPESGDHSPVVGEGEGWPTVVGEGLFKMGECRGRRLELLEIG
ncbi:hypothetical protein RHGRI_014786 [Rhododendron griersonianum]|uniref:Uncharacterized protein n=1 Tax=Rhododendron griersonianum TaxID=479676 RepID=A0AAV6KB46_9ERIC|nr:hypothetical protein RHGRI_014786 [Rhododendron griersonianum]